MPTSSEKPEPTDDPFALALEAAKASDPFTVAVEAAKRRDPFGADLLYGVPLDTDQVRWVRDHVATLLLSGHRDARIRAQVLARLDAVLETAEVDRLRRESNG